MKVRLAAGGAGLAVLAAALLPAAPASAGVVLPLAPVGSIDTVAVSYDTGGSAPTLHLTGWAADLNDRGANGLTTAGIEFTAASPGGARVSIGWAEHSDFAYPRADVPRVYPAAGPNQGFDIHTGRLPMTGPVNVCARLYNINAQPYTAVFTCINVTVPSARPPAASISGSAVAGSPLTVALAAPSGGTDSYAWTSWNPNGGNPSGYVEPIPGATAATYTTALGDVGRELRAIVTSRLPGVTIEQQTDPVNVTFPLTDGWTRVASSDRFATSVAVSQSAFPDSAAGVPVAYIASGVTFPDALSAGAAAAKQHGTLLLTRPGALDAGVAAELVRLHPQKIIVVGGVQAITEDVVAQLRALPFEPDVVRIGGADRFVVSRAIIDDAFGRNVPDLYLVTGNAFPDALSAAAAAAQTGRPVLLVNGWMAAADAATADALHRWGTTHVTVVGGSDVVTNGIASSLGVAVDRVSGSDRFATAAELARTLPRTGVTYMASGLNFPDALTAAVLAAAHPGPLLLATGWCAPVTALSAMRDTGVTRLVAVGGDAVLSTDSWYYAC
ncbi:cell wall-binding repeat-containing protein [Leifsonia sp. SIMBA_070]|uniref:cell wall-binding repeat-containing protein n=1 Tax=Leifsonia sp. SIMBA_070 TaxID=3085810 RepID=UPI0039790FC8